jgi:serine/threonine-protein kinase
MASDNLALAKARLGAVLKDRWQLEQVIGVGGMAAVYAARHRNGARAAIKLLHGPLSEDVVVRERFLREAYLANSVDHVGVVRVLDDDADPKLGPFLVMELLEGESMLDLLERGITISVDKALDILDQSLDVLAKAHDVGIVHRDLKPANLFICHNGTVKVLDFGIARLLDENFNRLTRQGVPLGTPAYMAPEQARGLGRDVDGRADVYAIGATIFRVLTGRHVHVGQGAAQIAMVAMQRAPRVATVSPKLPRGVCAVLDHALELEPADRYINAREMQGDVRRVRAGKEPQHAPLDPEPRRDTPSVPLSPTLPKKIGAPPRPKTLADSVSRLADQARERAHALAKRPDAFTVHGNVPMPSDILGTSSTFEVVPSAARSTERADPTLDDDMPTVTTQMPMHFASHEPSTLDPTPPAPVSSRRGGPAPAMPHRPNPPIAMPAHLGSLPGSGLEEATTDPGAHMGKGPAPEIDVAAVSMDDRTIESLRGREAAMRSNEHAPGPIAIVRPMPIEPATLATPVSQRTTTVAPPPVMPMRAPMPVTSPIPMPLPMPSPAQPDDTGAAPPVVMLASNQPTPVLQPSHRPATRPPVFAIVLVLLALVAAGVAGALVAKTFGLLQ